jgi:hypothetical protein
MPNENLIIGLFGTKGSGKSTLARAIVEEHSRVIVCDMLGEYDADTIACSVEDAIKCLVEHEHASTFSVSVRLSELEDYLDVLEVAYELTDTLVVLEEASFLCSASNFPPELSKLVRYGRHRRISQLYISRRPAEVARDVTAQADVLVTFRQREPRDLDYLYSCAPGARMSRREFGAYVEGLPDYRCAVFGDRESAPLAVIQATHRKLPGQGELFETKEETPVEPAEIADETDVDEEAAES